jgi:guanylate kinase
MKPHIMTITGPSCAGKSTLENMMKRRGFEAVISSTSREARWYETYGNQYYFRTRQECEEMHKSGDMIELTEFNGNYYGVGVQEVKRVAATGKPIVMVVEPEGLKQIRDFCTKEGWPLMTVFVTNPQEVIFKRFLERVREDAAGEPRADHSQKVIEAAAKRLVAMTTVERIWLADWANYTVLLDRFDETNADEVADKLERMMKESIADERGDGWLHFRAQSAA